MHDDIYTSLFEIVSFFNRPKQDKVLLKRAGVSLDTALFPLLMRIHVHISLSIGELADQVDRDYSTISRQVDKLIAGGLVVASHKVSDKRIRQVILTKQGLAIVKQVASARQKMMHEALGTWDNDQLIKLHESLEHLATTLKSVIVASK